DHNTITAQILGLYEAGISHLPYLVRVSANKFHLAWLSFLTRRLVILLTGSILVLGFILLFTRVEKTVLSNSRLILGLASFLTALFLTDFMNLEYLPFTLLAFKKIVVIARHVASIVFMLGFLQLIERKLDFFSRLFIAIQMLCSLVLLYPPTVHLLKQFYTFTYLTLIPMPLYLLYLLFNKGFKKRAYSILLCGVALATCAGVRDAIIPLLYPGATYYSHFGFMLLIISASWFIVLDELNHFRLFMQERSKSEQYRKESQQDPLTGVYNRSMLEAARSNLHSDYSIIIIDIDDLKEINDTFGHPTGDFVLRNLASRIQNLVRYDDLIIRYGGDEFLAILPRCSTERLVLLETRFRDEFARTQIPMSDGRELAYSVSVGSAHVSSLDKPSLNALDEAIIRADTRMYDNKRMKKRVEG
ncbi:MAG: GGDEF domain-containing protein, partial [Rectinema sp.]|nr:GGDEF domain-containing protein [Rectinema sp.]